MPQRFPPTLAARTMLRLQGAVSLWLLIALYACVPSRSQLRRGARAWIDAITVMAQAKTSSLVLCARIAMAVIFSHVTCHDCGATPFTTNVMRIQKDRYEYYCVGCWRKFLPAGRGLPTDIVEARWQFEVVGKGTVRIPVCATDISFPLQFPMCPIHLDQLRGAGVAVANGVDIFWSTEKFRNKLAEFRPDVPKWNLALFSGPHGVLSDGERHKQSEGISNGHFIGKAFRALQAHNNINEVLVLFAAHHLDGLLEFLNEHARSEPSWYSADYTIRPILEMPEMPGWAPRRSNPTTLAHNVCKSSSVYAIATHGDLWDYIGKGCVETPIDVKGACANATSLLCIGSGCAQLECDIVRSLLSSD